MSVIIDGGKFTSQRTREEVVRDFTERISNLSEVEFNILKEFLKEITGSNDKSWVDEEGNKRKYRLIDLYRLIEYEHEVVDPETWITDPYYFGNTGNELWPKLKEDFIELFSGNYHEVIMTGAIGTGKTFFSNVCLCRTIYEISCLRSPQKSHGQADGQMIAIVVFHVTKELAKKVVFDSIVNMIRNSPYFMEHFQPKITKNEIIFPKNIWLAPLSSNTKSAIGLNIYSALFDESNFKKREGGSATDINEAKALYDSVSRRMTSRFGRSGKVPGLIILPSSKQTEDDFTQTRLLESRNDSTVFARDYSQWSVLPPDRFTKKRFKVFVGSSYMGSRILESEEKIFITDEMKEDGCKIIEVPENFRIDFERDIDRSLREFAGIATVTIKPFITNRDKIYNAIDNRQHPFEFIEWDSISALTIKDKLFHTDEENDISRPILNPTAPRYIHLDPSLTGDATGFAMGHISEYINIVRRNRKTGGLVYENAPVIIIDIMLRIVPPKNGEVDQGAIRELIYTLSEIGFPIRFVSMDSYQSAGIKQKLKQKGYISDIISVDRKMDPYDMLKQTLYEDRIRYYNYKPFINEIKDLIEDHKKRKVDHLPKRSKDVADAVCGVVYGLTTRMSGEPMPLLNSISANGEYKEDLSWVVGERNKNKKVVNNSQPLPFFIG